ncbi:MAG: hypothetical protein OXU61_05425, partial [Gammaproteobacteria bacterium]|nr:hypothetical protein [Gammaproteobacteria bacterium]
DLADRARGPGAAGVEPAPADRVRRDGEGGGGGVKPVSRPLGPFFFGPRGPPGISVAGRRASLP